MNNNSSIRKLKHLLLAEDRGENASIIEQLRSDFELRTFNLNKALLETSSKLGQTTRDLEGAIEELNSLKGALRKAHDDLLAKSNNTIENSETITQLKSDFSSNKFFNEKLANSQSELVDVLAPQLGKLIRKSVQTEIDKISAKIDATKASLGSFNVFKKIKSKLGFGKAVEIRDLAAPEIEDVIVIDSGTGLLLGRFSKNEQTDMDILAGMFDAIRSFAETAFKKKDNQLDLIEYDSYKIKLHSYRSIYYAVIITGRVTPEFKIFIENELDEFTSTIYNELSSRYDSDRITTRLTEEMQIYFRETCKKLERKLYS